MQKQTITLAACLLLAACNNPQDVSSNIGFGITGYNARFIKMDSHARTVIHDYLVSEYKSDCSGKKHRHDPSCAQDRPFMTNGSIPVGTDTQPLPQDVMNQLGFVPPGTDFVQAGYNVYLIHHPDNIIYDNVSLHPYWKEKLRK